MKSFVKPMKHFSTWPQPLLLEKNWIYLRISSKYIQNQLGHASIQTTLDRYGYLIKEVYSEQAKKLDSILGFVEHSGSFSNLESVRSF
ncbi:MAG: hypothetical protein QY310_00515 [Candidatus Jettenia sp. CY-1]|nr:MAG: hypothetical protein QY310_00515 [Candidatus Jettenia sp. CY-1]